MFANKHSDHDRLVSFLVKLSDRYPDWVIVDNPAKQLIELRLDVKGKAIQSWTYDFILKNITY
jgi:hypothetical protein